MAASASRAWSAVAAVPSPDPAPSGQVEVDRLVVDTVGGHLVAVADGFEPHERGAGLDLAAGGDQQLLDPAGERRRQDGLHLHRLEHQHRRAGRDLGADARPGSRRRAPVPENAARHPRRG